MYLDLFIDKYAMEYNDFPNTLFFLRYYQTLLISSITRDSAHDRNHTTKPI